MHLLGIDVGTSGTKALLLRADDGTVAASFTAEHTLQTPKPGWTEQSPDEWWAASIKAVRGVLKRGRVRPGEVKAVGLSGQMHGSVFLDSKGRVIRPALLWNDQRTAEQSASILEKAGGPAEMLRLVGNLPLTGYTLPKIAWLREKEPKRFQQLASVVLPKDYVRLKLTGDVATDASDASGTCLLDVERRTWSGELLKRLNLDESLMPKVYESPEVTGTVSADGAAALGLRVGTPVVAGGGDVMTGAVGNGIVERGAASAVLGTSGVIAAHADRYAVDPDGRVATMASCVPGGWVVYGCMLSAAGSVQWYADTFRNRVKGVFDALMDLAATAPPGSDGVFFLPHLTGERCPVADPLARGGWVGATRATTEAHLIRSLVEGVTFNMRAMLEIIVKLGVPVARVRCTGGGAKSAFWRQLQADVYGVPLAVTTSEEGSALGAALLAGVGAGAFPSVETACKRVVRDAEIAQPNAKRAALYARHASVYDKLYGDLRERFAEIAAL